MLSQTKIYVTMRIDLV